MIPVQLTLESKECVFRWDDSRLRLSYCILEFQHHNILFVPVTPLNLQGLRTFGGPGPQWAVVIYDVVESEGQNEEGTVSGGIYLEGYIPLVQTYRLTLFSQ